jgi:hypothetical protein
MLAAPARRRGLACGDDAARLLSARICALACRGGSLPGGLPLAQVRRGQALPRFRCLRPGAACWRP